MKISKVAVSIVAALAVTAGGVVAATAQPTESRPWTVIGLNDEYAVGGVTITNPTKVELDCMLYVAEKKYIEPIFAPWNKPGISYDEAYRQSHLAYEEFSRLTSKGAINKWNLSQQNYFGAGETRGFSWMNSFESAAPTSGDGIYLECQPHKGFGTALVGYGVVQNDLTVKSTNLPTEAPKPVSPDQKPAATVTVTAPPTTVVTTTTITAKPKEPAPVTTTVKETVTEAASAANQPKLVTTTVHETATTTVTATPKEPAPVTTTVTKTAAPAPVKEQSTEELIGWIVGIIVALGLGGVAGFMAQNLPLPHL